MENRMDGLLLILLGFVVGTCLRSIMNLIERKRTNNFRQYFLFDVKQVEEAKSELRSQLVGFGWCIRCNQPIASLNPLIEAIDRLARSLVQFKILLEAAQRGWDPILGSIPTGVPSSSLSMAKAGAEDILKCLKQAEQHLREHEACPAQADPWQAWNSLVQAAELMDGFKIWLV